MAEAEKETKAHRMSRWEFFKSWYAVNMHCFDSYIPEADLAQINDTSKDFGGQEKRLEMRRDRYYDWLRTNRLEILQQYTDEYNNSRTPI
jgi:hypothetical protein